MLTLKHVSYQIKQQVIFEDVTADLAEHEITCLIGPNGVGKSTLFQLITGSRQPQSGTITNQPQKMALLAQHNELFEPLTVRELLTMQRETLDEEVLSLLHLTSLLDKQVLDLSGGQRQLAWLGYVLHQEPELLLLDEPTTYLDLHYQHIFLEALTTLQKARGFTVLMILHDLTQAFAYSQNIWLVNQTKGLMTGTVAELRQADVLSAAFNVPLDIVAHEERFLIVPH